MAKVTFPETFKNGSIWLYRCIFSEIYDYMHLIKGLRNISVYINTMWILGAYLHFWSAVTCIKGIKNRVKFILCFMSLGAWKIGNNTCALRELPGAQEKLESGDASQFPG